MMKFKENDILYYVCPFVFYIEKVRISMAVLEDEIYYIDQTGGYLKEYDLHETLEEAKIDAINKLNNFYANKNFEILKTKDEHLKVNEDY